MSKYRVKFSKTGKAAYISHLDLIHTMQRIFVRSGLKLTHTQGFNPHPKMVFAVPLPVGTESECELLDFELNEDVPFSDIPKLLNARMPVGITVLECRAPEAKLNEISWLKVVGRFEYDNGDAASKLALLREFFRQEKIVILKRTKRGMADTDILPSLRDIAFDLFDSKTILVTAIVGTNENSLNPELLIEALKQLKPEIMPSFGKFKRIELYKTVSDGDIVPFR